jgi:hypothetical protein
MTTVTLERQIARIASRVAQLESFLRACPNVAPLTVYERKRELEEYSAVLATLIGHRAANEAAGFAEQNAAPQGAKPPAVTGDTFAVRPDSPAVAAP